MKKINLQPVQKTDSASINPIYYVISCALFPIIIGFLSIFSIWRFIANCILSLQYKNKFGGILNGADSVWALDDSSKMIINAAIIVERNGNDANHLLEKIKNTFNKSIFKDAAYSKLWSFRQKALGYNFLINNEVSVEDCVSFITIKAEKDDILTKDELQILISEYSNKSLPKGNRALWQILVCDKPIMWNNSIKYSVLIRMSHVLGDGFAIIKLLSHHLTDEMPENVDFVPDNNSRIKRDDKFIFNYLIKILKNLLSNLYIVLIGPAIIMHQTRLRPEDKSILRGSELSGKKLAVWVSEEKEHLIPLIKSIKNKLNCRFSEVLLTAISESLNNYFYSKTEEVPKFATAVIPLMLTPMDYRTKPDLHNHFSVGMLQLPISQDVNLLSNRLKLVKNQSKVLHSSFDYAINYWLITVVSKVLPEGLLRLVLSANKSTMVVTNVPGVRKLSIFDGYEADEIIFWIPNRGTTGLGFSFLTYNNKMQLGLLVDKALIASEIEAKSIVDNVFKCIEAFNKELM